MPLSGFWTHEHYTRTRCTQVHTHGRIDIRTHVRTEANTQVHMYNHGSKKLEVGNKKCRACTDERTHVGTNIWTHKHARGQTDGRTQTYGLTHACMQTHERMP